MSRPYFEPPNDGSGGLDPHALVSACFEHDTRALLLDEGVLPPAFFDLSSGVAGELVQRLVNYGLRMAAVVPDPGKHSGPFQDFAREASTSGPIRFFTSRDAALQWLASADAAR